MREPLAVKVAWAVLWGGDRGNAVLLPDFFPQCLNGECCIHGSLMPIQIVLAPGSPSLLRPRNPAPPLTASIGQCATPLPQRQGPLHTIHVRQLQRFDLAAGLQDVATSHRARYQSTSSMTASASCACRFVNSRQTTGLTPAGAPISLASTQVSAGPARPGSITRPPSPAPTRWYFSAVAMTAGCFNVDTHQAHEVVIGPVFKTPPNIRGFFCSRRRPALQQAESRVTSP